jgi:dTDP-glucose pyrophosphorylase
MIMDTAAEGPVVGVILAAGKGSRMYPFSASFPKPLLPVCNKPLLAYHIEAMVALGIREIFIVIGHCGFEIVKALGIGDQLGAKIHYVEQEETIGIAHAVGKLEPYLDRPFLLFLGDIYFQTDHLGRMLEAFTQGEVSAVLATKQEPDPAAIRRNFAVIEGSDGYVRRVIEKPRHIVSTLKGCGLYLFDLHIFDAIRRTPRTAMRDEYEITDSVQILIDDGFKVKSLCVIEEDINLTFPADLLSLNLAVLKKGGRASCIGKNVRMHAGARIADSIVGDGAVIEQAISIRDSLVFRDARVRSGEDIRRAIVSGTQVIPCGPMLLSENVPVFKGA